MGWGGREGIRKEETARRKEIIERMKEENNSERRKVSLNENI